jgi:hypothetical protein
MTYSPAIKFISSFDRVNRYHVNRMFVNIQYLHQAHTFSVCRIVVDYYSFMYTLALTSWLLVSRIWCVGCTRGSHRWGGSFYRSRWRYSFRFAR